MRMGKAIAVSLLVTLGAPTAGAQEKVDDLKGARLDLSVPDVPAFTALGVSPSTITRPDNVKDLVAAIASAVGSGGSVQSGVALEVSPAKLWANATSSSAPLFHDVLGGLRVSGATNAATDQPGGHTLIAVGARYSWTSYHPETDSDLGDCVLASVPPRGGEDPVRPGDDLGSDGVPANDAPDGRSPTTAPPTPEEAPGSGSSTVTLPDDAWTKVRVVDIEQCHRVFRAAHLASGGVEIAAVHTEGAVASTKLSDMHPDTNSTWVALTYPIWRKFEASTIRKAFQDAHEGKACARSETELERRRCAWHTALGALSSDHDSKSALTFAPILFGRLDSRRIAPDRSTERQTDVYMAARVPLTADGWSVFAEGGYKLVDVTKVTSPSPKDSLPIGIGGDVRLANGTWLGVYAGADALNGALLSLGNIKWSLGETRPY